jgi:hypothetical protein
MSKHERVTSIAATSSADTHQSFPAPARAGGVRDSVLTQQSVSSSSLYPPSTSTASGTDSTSPHSVVDQFENCDEPSFEPEIDEIQDFHGDDVSYRLRLLMKNNYFLPPAHAKPSVSDFATAKKALRQPTPTFLDLFRVGRSKPKPLSSSPPEFSAPILRTTSDSTTASGYVPGPQTRSLPTTPRLGSHAAPSQDRTGRVVVVREKMNDLVGAAKQAEQEMKTRSIRREQGSQRGQLDSVNDVIDPTDAVDLPPPSTSYPFAVQASALHGLGVEDSVGAAVLAEQLPPPNSPGMSLLSPEEYAWRKALLHAAVGHSLQNSPAMSTTSPSPVVKTSLDSPQLSDSSQPSRVVSMKRMLGQTIIAQPLIEQNEDSPSPSPRIRTGQARRERGLASPESHVSPRPPSYLPSRAETPAAPPTPLAPAPRRQIVNPLYSLSQTDLSRTSESAPSASSPHHLRRAASSPHLSDAYEAMPMTPPPVPDLKASCISSRSQFDSSFENNRNCASMATTSDSHYSEEDPDPPRDSTTLSIPTTGRPSLSDYSQPSPTASAFQDALDYEYHSSSPNLQSSTENPTAPSRLSHVSSAPRYSTMSPPPRVSSSLANFVLSPPPRSTSLPQQLLISRLSTSTRSQSSSEAAHYSTQPIRVPEPHTTFPIPERRGIPIPLVLQIPSYNAPLSIRSAPPPASPIAFFDDIQNHPNAMDDLDSSSDEDENDGEHTPVLPHPRARSISSLSASSPQPLIMRLGNRSTPHVSRSYERGPSLPIGPTSPSKTFESKKPVGNIPSRPTFFNDKKYSKSDQGHGPPMSAMDLYRFTQHSEQKSLRPPMSNVQGVQVGRAWQSDQRVQESLRRLDGMLIQHMEAERDTIKRIATSARQTNG